MFIVSNFLAKLNKLKLDVRSKACAVDCVPLSLVTQVRVMRKWLLYHSGSAPDIALHVEI